MSDLTERAKKIKLVIFDVDGVLTDGRLIIGDDGLEYKCFNTQDGLGMIERIEGTAKRIELFE
jgi:3-deoxy-D-manno-octulosonate 8-phosphate phosphatase (KDO 8-P phosphatase)